MSVIKKKIPASALNFNASADSVNVSFKDVDGKQEPQVYIVGYSGGVFKHNYWGNLGIDLTGMQFPKSKYPILRDHDTDKPIAFTSNPKIVDNQLVVDEATFMDTPFADDFLKLSAGGFPFEASIKVDPYNLVLEFIDEGQSVEVNGHILNGPGTVFRKSIFKEVSVCVFGYDSNTNSAAFSKGGSEVELSYTEVHSDNKNSQEERFMGKLVDFKKDHPEAYVELKAEVVTEMGKDLETKFSADVAVKDAEIIKLKEDIAKFSQNDGASNDRLVKLEKELAMFKEKSIRDNAAAILATSLSQSELPDRLVAKIHVPYTKFVKDDVLDVAAFSAAIATEVAEWKTIVTEATPAMFGGGTAPAAPGAGSKTEFTEEDATTAAKSLLKSLGHTIS